MVFGIHPGNWMMHSLNKIVPVVGDGTDLLILSARAAWLLTGLRVAVLVVYLCMFVRCHNSG